MDRASGQCETTLPVFLKIMNTLSYWNPFEQLEQMPTRLWRAMHVTPSRHQRNGEEVSMATAAWIPRIDLSEDENEYLLKAELPEVERNDIKVRVDDGVLTLSGERRFEKEESNKTYHLTERSYGIFARSLSLPEDADADRISAEFKDGLLRISLPKSESKKPKEIQIKVH